MIGEIEKNLKAILIRICSSIYVGIIEMEIMPDHVHMPIEVDTQFGVHRAIKLIKGTTSYLMRKEFQSLNISSVALWTNSYFISTVGGAPLEIIKQYIETQKER